MRVDDRQLGFAWSHGTGAQRKERVLDVLEKARAFAIVQVRDAMRQLYLDRVRRHDPAFVTGDDAARAYDDLVARGELGMLPRTFLGAVFRNSDDWEAIPGGFIQSSQPKNHARLLRQWRLRGVR